MTKKLLVESAGKPTLAEDGSFRAVMITPGAGSSGVYSEEVLRRDAQTAFPPGTISWINHPSESNPVRDPRDMFGTYPDGAHYEEGVGIVGRFVPLPHMREFAEAVAPHAALSIYAMGESDIHGNVTALVPDVQNSVDLVGYPGRSGSGLTQMYEAARAAALAERTATVADEKKETKMTPEEREAFKAELLTALKAFVTESSAVVREKEKPSEDAIAAAVSEARKSTVAALEAVNEAGLPDTIRKNLVAAVEGGKTEVAPIIENAKATVDALRAELKQEADNGRQGFVLNEQRKVESANDEGKATWTSLFGGK